MLSIPRFLRMGRGLPALRKGFDRVAVRSLPAGIQKVPCDFSYSTSADSNLKEIPFLDNLEAKLANKANDLDQLLNDTGNTKFEKPFTPTGTILRHFKDHLSATPLDDTGMAILKFLLKHGEKDSEFERKILNKLLQDVDEYNALGMVTILDCFEYTDTALRWAVVDLFERELWQGLYQEDPYVRMRSIPKYNETPLFPVLLNICYQTSKIPKRGHGDVYSYINALKVFGQSTCTDYSFVSYLESWLHKIRFRKIRFDLLSIRLMLISSILNNNRNSPYLQMLGQHLKSELMNLKYGTGIENRRDISIRCSDCLIFYAILGYYEEEVVELMVENISLESLPPNRLIKVFSALSMLNHPKLDFLDKAVISCLHEVKPWEMKYAWTRALVDQQLIDGNYVQRNLKYLKRKLSMDISNGTLTKEMVSTYYTLKAYSELDLGIPVDISIDESAFTSVLNLGVETLQRKTVQFVVNEMFGHSSLIRGPYYNQYGQKIDLEFNLDNELRIQDPDSYEGKLTRFTVLSLEENDVIIHEKRKLVPRGPQNTKIRQLSKLTNGKVLPVFFHTWNDLGDRHRRTEFLWSEIKAQLGESLENE